MRRDEGGRPQPLHHSPQAENDRGALRGLPRRVGYAAKAGGRQNSRVATGCVTIGLSTPGTEYGDRLLQTPQRFVPILFVFLLFSLTLSY